MNYRVTGELDARLNIISFLSKVAQYKFDFFFSAKIEEGKREVGGTA